MDLSTPKEFRSSADYSDDSSPAEEAIKYEKWRFNATLVIDSPYNGPPGEEVDEAWRELLHNMNMPLPGSDLRRLGTTSIPVPDRDDTYIAGMSVFHELHCLKRLRQYNYRDHYFPNITADEERLNRLHTDHCIDVLRQGIMCHADISLFTLQWSRDSLMPRADFSGEHECRNWGAINERAGERRIDLSVPGLLVHPFRGVAFPDGKGSLIGGSEDRSPTVT
ncbi:MAG: hypothetical protein ASARMPRED_007619 [Alectoria sarmentosa]|nr:MAG: hypothetical protein ASARMPRED_007619 [Alectoria sarmentosa]